MRSRFLRHRGSAPFLLLLSLIVLAGCEQASDSATEPVESGPPTVGDIVPAWSGTSLVDGSAQRFPELLDGKPAVVVFWATWCPYCKAFMPYAGQIQQEFSDAGVQVIALNAKERGRGDPRAYVESLGFPTVAIANADDIAARYGVEFIPGLMVVDGQGVLIYQRGWTDLPPGQKVAEQWASEVRAALSGAIQGAAGP